MGSIIQDLLPYVDEGVLATGLLDDVVQNISAIPEGVFDRVLEKLNKPELPVIEPLRFTQPTWLRSHGDATTTPASDSVSTPDPLSSSGAVKQNPFAKDIAEVNKNRSSKGGSSASDSGNKTRLRETQLLTSLLSFHTSELEGVPRWMQLREKLEKTGFLKSLLNDIETLANSLSKGQVRMWETEENDESDSNAKRSFADWSEHASALSSTSFWQRSSQVIYMLQETSDLLYLFSQHCSSVEPSVRQLEKLGKTVIGLHTQASSEDCRSHPLHRTVIVLSCFLSLYPLCPPQCVMDRVMGAGDEAAPYWLVAVSTMAASAEALRANEEKVRQRRATDNLRENGKGNDGSTSSAIGDNRPASSLRTPSSSSLDDETEEANKALSESFRTALQHCVRTVVYSLPVGHIFRGEGVHSSVKASIHRLMASLVHRALQYISMELWSYFSESALFSIAEAAAMYGYYWPTFPVGMANLREYTVFIVSKAEPSASQRVQLLVTEQPQSTGRSANSHTNEEQKETNEDECGGGGGAGGDDVAALETETAKGWRVMRGLALHNFYVAALAYQTPLAYLVDVEGGTLSNRSVASALENQVSTVVAHGVQARDFLRQSMTLLSAAAETVLSVSLTGHRERSSTSAYLADCEAVFLRSGLFLLHSLLTNYPDELSSVSRLLDCKIESIVQTIVNYSFSLRAHHIPTLEVLCGIIALTQNTILDPERICLALLRDNVVRSSVHDSTALEAVLLHLQLYNTLLETNPSCRLRTRAPFLHIVCQLESLVNGAPLALRMYEEWLPALHALLEYDESSPVSAVVRRGLSLDASNGTSFIQQQSYSGSSSFIQQVTLFPVNAAQTVALIVRIGEAIALGLELHDGGSYFFCEQSCVSLLEMAMDALYAASCAGNQDVIATSVVSLQCTELQSLPMLLLTMCFCGFSSQRVIEKAAAIVADVLENSKQKMFTTVRRSTSVAARNTFTLQMYQHATHGSGATERVAMIRLILLKALLNYDPSLFFYLTSADDSDNSSGSGSSTSSPSTNTLEKLFLVQVLNDNVVSPGVHSEVKSLSLDILRMLGCMRKVSVSILVSVVDRITEQKEVPSQAGDRVDAIAGALLVASSGVFIAQHVATAHASDLRSAAAAESTNISDDQNKQASSDRTMSATFQMDGASRTSTPLTGPAKPRTYGVSSTKTVQDEMYFPACNKTLQKAHHLVGLVLGIATEQGNALRTIGQADENETNKLASELASDLPSVPWSTNDILAAVNEGKDISDNKNASTGADAPSYFGVNLPNSIDKDDSVVHFSEAATSLAVLSRYSSDLYARPQSPGISKQASSLWNPGHDANLSASPLPRQPVPIQSVRSVLGYLKRVRFGHGETYAFYGSFDDSGINIVVSALDAATRTLKAMEMLVWCTASNAPSRLSSVADVVLASALSALRFTCPALPHFRRAARACVLAALDLVVAFLSSLSAAERITLTATTKSSLPAQAASVGSDKSTSPSYTDCLQEIVACVWRYRADKVVVYRGFTLLGVAGIWSPDALGKSGTGTVLISQVAALTANVLDALKDEKFSAVKDVIVVFITPLCRHVVSYAASSAIAKLVGSLWRCVATASHEIVAYGPVSSVSHHFTRTLEALSTLLYTQPSALQYLPTQELLNVFITLASNANQHERAKNWLSSSAYHPNAAASLLHHSEMVCSAAEATSTPLYVQYGWHHAWLGLLRFVHAALVATAEVDGQACTGPAYDPASRKRFAAAVADVLETQSPRFIYALSLFDVRSLLRLDGPLSQIQVNGGNGGINILDDVMNHPLFSWDLHEAQVCLSITAVLCSSGFPCTTFRPFVQDAFAAAYRYRVRTISRFAYAESDVSLRDVDRNEAALVSVVRDTLVYMVHQPTSTFSIELAAFRARYEESPEAMAPLVSIGALVGPLVSRKNSNAVAPSVKDESGSEILSFNLLRTFIIQEVTIIRKLLKDSRGGGGGGGGGSWTPAASVVTSPQTGALDSHGPLHRSSSFNGLDGVESVVESVSTDILFTGNLSIHLDNVHLSLRLFLTYAHLYNSTTAMLTVAERKELGDNVEKLYQSLVRLLADVRRLDSDRVLRLLEAVCADLRQLSHVLY